MKGLDFLGGVNHLHEAAIWKSNAFPLPCHNIGRGTALLVPHREPVGCAAVVAGRAILGSDRSTLSRAKATTKRER